jgi:predicted amidophosphoribosyltransferase
MLCTNCETSVDSIDNFCRHCGAPLNGSMLPVPAPQSYAMVPWRNVAVTVAQGAAAIAISAALEVAARALVKRAVRVSGSVIGSKAFANSRPRRLPTEVLTESHTVLVRRVIVR